MSDLQMQTKTHTDQELLEEMSREILDALGEFYDRHSGLVYGVLLRLLGSKSDAERVLIDVFTRIWYKSGRYNPLLSTPKDWLIVIAYNKAMNHKRMQIQPKIQNKLIICE